jgi:hypothetical protein
MTEETIRDQSGCDCLLCRFRTGVRASETRRHVKNARREMLLAARSVIDHCLARLDDREEQPTGGARKVDIE